MLENLVLEADVRFTRQKRRQRSCSKAGITGRQSIDRAERAVHCTGFVFSKPKSPGSQRPVDQGTNST